MTDFAPLTLETPAEHPFAPFVRILGKGKRGARNLPLPDWADSVDYPGFVQLSIDYDKVNTWL